MRRDLFSPNLNFHRTSHPRTYTSLLVHMAVREGTLLSPSRRHKATKAESYHPCQNSMLVENHCGYPLQQAVSSIPTSVYCWQSNVHGQQALYSIASSCYISSSPRCYQDPGLLRTSCLDPSFFSFFDQLMHHITPSACFDHTQLSFYSSGELVDGLPRVNAYFPPSFLHPLEPPSTHDSEPARPITTSSATRNLQGREIHTIPTVLLLKDNGHIDRHGLTTVHDPKMTPSGSTYATSLTTIPSRARKSQD